MTSWVKFMLFVPGQRADCSRLSHQPIKDKNRVAKFQVNRITTCLAREIMARNISRSFANESQKSGWMRRLTDF